MRIGFLFNHDQIHQVAHSLPVALALAESGAGAEIVVATTGPRLTAEVRRLAGAAIAGVTLVELGLRRWRSRVAARLLGGVVPAAKLLVYGDNLDFFRSLDVLVVAEKTSLRLKSRFGLDRLRLIHTRHGAGDRAIGFDAASTGFDHVLAAGPKIRDRLVAAGVTPARISIVGYPKFDLPAAAPVVLPGGGPVVLYNPHPSPRLSSWFRDGRAVLDWFVAHPEYRLIFAPHVMLFERSWVVTIDPPRLDRPGRIADKYLRAPNILIDLGSRRSTTMAYTDRADIYLGDASSQVYEFLRRPRPCLFLDSHATDWAGDANFAHWAAGPVIDRAAGLAAALAADHAAYRPVQAALFARSIELTAEPSAVRAARVVASVAHG